MRRALVAGVLAAAFVAAGHAPAGAHWTSCSSGWLRWPARNTTYSFPSSWDSSYQTAVRNAAASITTTDFDYYYATPQSAMSLWFKSNYGRNGWSGYSNETYDSSTCHIIAGSFYFNEYYTGSYGTAKRQAVGIHEMGHGIGAADVNDGCVLRTMMQGSDGCMWDKLRINTVQSHDVSDINKVY